MFGRADQVLVTIVAAAATMLSVRPTGAASPTYYLALGDSLARGVGAGAGQGYVDDIFAFEQASMPDLQLVNLSCSGETTASMINGGPCMYATGSQLGDAAAFLAAHPGEVAFVTIDIGGNDVVPCFYPPDAACVQSALPNAAANLETIMAGLRVAGAAVPIIGMRYYDPFVASWLQGGAGQTAARDSLKLLKAVNRGLKKVYRHHRARVVDGLKAFGATKWTLTGSYAGQTVPINVANVCAWTSMCSMNDFHANSAGCAVLAAAFEQEIGKALAAH